MERRNRGHGDLHPEAVLKAVEADLGEVVLSEPAGEGREDRYRAGAVFATEDGQIGVVFLSSGVIM